MSLRLTSRTKLQYWRWRRGSVDVGPSWYRESGLSLTRELPGPRIVASSTERQSREHEAPPDHGTPHDGGTVRSAAGSAPASAARRCASRSAQARALLRVIVARENMKSTSPPHLRDGCPYAFAMLACSGWTTARPKGSPAAAHTGTRLPRNPMAFTARGWAPSHCYARNSSASSRAAFKNAMSFANSSSESSRAASLPR